MRKILLYICATGFLIGGVMGIMNNLFPSLNLSFRALLGGDAFFAGDILWYIRAYGIVMGVLEVLAAIIIFLRKRHLLILVEIVLVINFAGCVVAIVMGDSLAVISLLLRLVPIYIVHKEHRKNKTDIREV